MRKIIAIIVFTTITISSFAQTSSESIDLLILKQNYPQALRQCRELIQSYPENAHAYYQQALIYKFMYRYSDALKSIKKALDLKPEQLDYLAEYGIVLDKKEREDEAVKIFSQVFEKNNHHYYSGIWLGNYYLKKKKYDLALEVLGNLYYIDSTNNYLARSIGLTWYKKGVYEKSKEWFSKAIQLDSSDIKSYKYLFSTYAGKEEFDLAFEIINKAIQISPSNKYLYIMKGDLHVIRNHHFQAIKTYNNAFAIDPNGEDIARKLGLSHYKTKEYDKAKYYLLLADKGQMHLEVYKHLGYIYKMENKPDSSNTYFSKALEILRPDNNTIFNIYVDIAENNYELSKYRHAIGWYDKSLKLELTGIWHMSMKNKVLIDVASIYADKIDDKEMAIEYFKRVTEDTTFFVNEKDYYQYAQQQITKLEEELFFEGDL